MASLDLLPVELILKICSHLDQGQPPEKGPRDLSRLSRTSRHLLAIAQPLLFTSFNYSNPPVTQLSKLLRALDLRPDLASHFRHFKVQLTPNIWCDLSNGTSPEDTRLVNSHVAKLGLPPLDSRDDPGHLPQWYGTNLNGQIYKIRCPVILLLVELVVIRIAPTLTFLSLPIDTRWKIPALTRHRTLAGPASKFFPRLRVLEITPLHNDYGSDLDFVSDAGLFVPSLRELWTYTPTIDIDDAPLGPTSIVPEITQRYPDMRFLRRLEFQGSVNVRVRVVHVMLASMQKLEVLGLSWHGNNAEGELWDAIAQCKGTLRELRIDNSSRGQSTELKASEMRRLHSLEGFERLEVLKIGPGMLWALWSAWNREHPGRDRNGFLEEMFPVGVREVTIWEPSREFRAGLERLAGAVARFRYPRLGRVVIARPETVTSGYWDQNMDGFWEGARVGLQKAFEAVGMQLVMDLTSRGSPPEPAAFQVHDF